MTTIMLFPQDKDLDLNDKSDLKLHETVCNWLKAKDKFDGSIEKAGKFLNLFGKYLSDCRLKSFLNILVECDASGKTPKAPAKLMDVFDASNVAKEQVIKH